jgi:ATP-dependent DNA helicase RecG
MNIRELQERIAQWEDLHTEFKDWPVQPDDLAASLVAFANTDGGQLILGVTNNRVIVGVDDADRVTRDVDNVAANNCEPPLTVIQEVLHPPDAGEKAVIVANVPKGDMRPYRTNRGRYYIRTTSGRRDASREELLRLFQATESLYYDETPLPRLTLSDLDLNAFERYLEKIGQEEFKSEPERLLTNWGLLSDGHPTVAGVVLFAHDPQRHLPFAQINAARFPGTDSSVDPLDRKDLKGRLLDVIDQAERFLDLHLRTPHKIVGFEPEPRPELPKEALREAIVNAVAHRDYTVRGPVRVFIFNDRIEVHTPGKLPNTVTEDAMRAGVHVVRNPRIYARLSDAGLVTRAGTGIRRIIRLVREATGEDVGIKVSESEVVLTLPRKPPERQ